MGVWSEGALRHVFQARRPLPLRRVGVPGPLRGTERRQRRQRSFDSLAGNHLYEAGETISDILYNDYRPAGQGWVAAQMLFSVDGQRRWLEEYVDIKTDAPVSEAVFDLKQWKATK